MTWLLTSTGRQHYLAAPTATHPDNVQSLGETAHALAHINRYTGHASRPYSVAEHSMLCVDIAIHVFNADALGQLAAGGHDGHKSITGDVSSPVKMVLGSAWADFEGMHEHHFRMHHGLLGAYKKYAGMVKQCDLIALATERRDLMPFDRAIHAPWPVIDTPGHVVRPWSEVSLCRGERAATTPRQWAWIWEQTMAALLESTQHQRQQLDAEYGFDQE